MKAIDVEASNVSEAWLGAVRALQRQQDQKAFHTVVRIARPTEEEPAVRQAVDQLLAELDLYSVETVANTIFPAELAATSRDHTHLVERYRRMYPVLRSRLQTNRSGTYFGRLVAYPMPGGESFDQIGALVSRLATELGTRQAKSARYEVALESPVDFASPAQVEDPAPGEEMEEGEDAPASVAAQATPIYIPGLDNRAMGFPCLSHCSFQLGRDGRLHALAQYRSQVMVQRGYGNYLGLGRLLNHVATQAEVQVGDLTVVAGYACVETAKGRVRRLVTNTYTLF